MKPLVRSVLASLLAFVACDAEEPAQEPPIDLPSRDGGSTDAGADVPIIEPEKDAAPDVDVPLDPCAASELVSCFTFEDAVTDAKATLVSAEVTSVTFVPGKTGKAADLVAGSKIRFNASSAIATPAASVEAFLKLPATFAAEATVFEVDDRHVMTIESDRTLLCASPGGAARGLQVPLTKWVHVACVFGGGAVIAYVDGVAGPSNAAFTGMPAAAAVVTEIGNDTPDGTRPLLGAIDTLRVFSDVRTPAEVAAAAKQ